MCLNITGKPVYLIASTNIIVYKVIRRRGNKSQYQRFPYQPHTTYTLGGPIRSHFSEVDAGFHSYVNRCAAEVYAKSWGTRNLKVVEFIIPKGTRYIIGTFNRIQSIASEAIRTGSLESVFKKKA